ncbi:MAG: hypothetical protein AB1894_10540 [Chloroflexota bacterium]
MEIYYVSYASRGREARFFEAFLPLGAKPIYANYRLPAELLEQLVDRQALLDSLRYDRKLSAGKRQRCIEILQTCPAQIKVALDVGRISCDIVVVAEGRPYYWEFHEEQHRKLSVDRPKQVYGADGRAVTVPRFVQRLVRDVWRAQYLRPYTIVWSDWFEVNGGTYKPVLAEGFQEFYLPGAFSFGKF